MTFLACSASAFGNWRRNVGFGPRTYVQVPGVQPHYATHSWHGPRLIQPQTVLPANSFPQPAFTRMLPNYFPQLWGDGRSLWWEHRGLLYPVMTVPTNQGWGFSTSVTGLSPQIWQAVELYYRLYSPGSLHRHFFAQAPVRRSGPGRVSGTGPRGSAAPLRHSEGGPEETGPRPEAPPPAFEPGPSAASPRGFSSPFGSGATGSGEFMIEDCRLPIEDQGNTWRCLQFATSALIERLICRQTNRLVDLDPYYFIRNAKGSQRYTDQNGVCHSFNEFTDQPEAFLDVAEKYGVRGVRKKVLFWHPHPNPWANGGISGEQLEQMKQAMRTYHQPVLFVWKHSSVSYWHASLCFGYDDTKQVLKCRDSALGEVREPGRRDIYEMPYQIALEGGKHATVYYLPEDVPSGLRSAGLR